MKSYDCAHCGEAFTRDIQPGRPPRFCSVKHRAAFHNAATAALIRAARAAGLSGAA